MGLDTSKNIWYYKLGRKRHVFHQMIVGLLTPVKIHDIDPIEAFQISLNNADFILLSPQFIARNYVHNKYS